MMNFHILKLLTMTQDEMQKEKVERSKECSWGIILTSGT